MQIQTQRIVDKYAGQVLCAALSLAYKLAPRLMRNQVVVDAANHEVKNIAVLMLSEMGSMVLAQPLIAELKRRYPVARIHVVQLGKNQEIARLLGFTSNDCLHAIDDSSLGSLLGSLYRLIKKLRSMPVDAVVDCELFARISASIAALSGAPLLAGFTPHTQEGLYRGSHWNCALPYNPYRHISDQFVSLAKALEKPTQLDIPRSREVSNLSVLPSFQPRPLLLQEGELDAAITRLHADFPQIQNKPLVLMYPGGGILPIRAWPESSFAATAKALLAAGCAVGFIGLPIDKPLAKRLAATLGNEAVIDLTGYTQSIRELLVLFHHAKLLITNDGGPGHFAALTPIHTLMFFGPETPALYAPLRSAYEAATSHAFYAGVPCSPCLTAYNHRESFCDGHNVCLQAISAAAVSTKALSVLGLQALPPEVSHA